MRRGRVFHRSFGIWHISAVAWRRNGTIDGRTPAARPGGVLMGARRVEQSNVYYHRRRRANLPVAQSYGRTDVELSAPENSSDSATAAACWSVCDGVRYEP